MAGTYMCVYHVEEKLPRLLGWNHTLQRWTFDFAAKISGRIENRIGRSYPSVTLKKTGMEEKSGERCSLVQLFWLFLIGAFLGDIVETLFCRITAGVWMSRSSLVWGDFSIVWGLAAVVWIKGLYPKISRLVDAILRKTGRVLTVALAAFMALDICVSVLALIRYDTRASGKAAEYGWEQAVDEHFGDARMERIYPNAVQQ